MSYIPDQGDIITLDFDPSAGKEIMKRRPAYVLSRLMFNQHTSFAIVAPITSTIRGIRLEVILPEDMEIKGSILIYQLKSLDFRKWNAEFVEKTSRAIIQQVASVAQVLIR